MTKEKLVYLAIAIVFCGTLLSYFARPKAPHLELVPPEQIQHGVITDYRTANLNLADRVLNSYGMALVFVQSPFSPDNTNALEALRSWARDNYLADRGFLHPVSLDSKERRTDTVFGALTHNLLGGPYYFARSRIGDLVKARVAEFQHSQSYTTVADTYFELFGDEPEAALLLARYQSDRAKLSLDVVLAATVWITATGGALWYIFSPVYFDGFTSATRKTRFIRMQQSLAGLWLMLGASYLISASVHNEVGTFLAAFLSIATGLYALRPFVVRAKGKGVAGLTFMHTNPVLIAVFAWATYSLLAIQMMSWLKTPFNATPDPITLLFSASTGDFMHDHGATKQIVKYSVGAFWLFVVTWVMWVRHRDGQSFVEDRLLVLDEPGTERDPALVGSSSHRRAYSRLERVDSQSHQQ
jgi:hypothetical protein